MRDEHDFAFPQHWTDNDGNGGGYFGLTKREYFAGLAMQGVIQQCAGDRPPAGMSRDQYFAVMAVHCADALIAALNAEQQP